MSLSERTKQQYGADATESFLRDRPPMPRNMMVELSNACNHACTFCPNPHMTRRIGRVDDDLLMRVMTQAHAAGVREIGFYTTGDPFIHKGLAGFTRHAKATGFEYIYISTNGALASPARARDVIDAGMDSIKFSINAGSRETYKFIHGRDDWDIVNANLKAIASYRKTHAPNLKLYITCVVTRQIEHEVTSIRERFSPLVDEVWFDPCTVMALPDIATAPNHGVCHMPFNRLHVTYEGYLTLCCVDFQNYLAVADLRAMSVEEAWNSDAFRDIRQRHLEQRLEGTFCGRCWNGDKGPIKPLVDAYAAELDFDAYDEVQRRWVTGSLRSDDRRVVANEKL